MVIGRRKLRDGWLVLAFNIVASVKFESSCFSKDLSLSEGLILMTFEL